MSRISDLPAPPTPDPATRLRQSPSWPRGPLDAAQRAFDLLTGAPTSLVFDCRGVAGLPQQHIALAALRTLLLQQQTSRASRDLAWAQLVKHARSDGPAWVVAVVGIAMPGLRRRAGQLAAGWHGDTADLDSELLTGFLERLTSIDLEAPNICRRLIDAGARAVQRSRRHHQELPILDHDRTQLPAADSGDDHPDFILARALAAAIIGPEEHLLISATRLEGLPLAGIAHQLGVSARTATTWRQRAEHHLTAAIRTGELHPG